jgi:hypothetical protein
MCPHPRIARAAKVGICSPFVTFNSSTFEHGTNAKNYKRSVPADLHQWR